MLLTTISVAQTRPELIKTPQQHELRQCVKDCNRALKTAREYIESIEEVAIRRQLLLEHRERQLAETRAQLSERLEEQQRWYKNPSLTITGGLALGLLVGVLVSSSR